MAVAPETETPLAPEPHEPHPSAAGDARFARRLILPGRLLLLLLVVFPTLMEIYIGFTQWGPTTGSDWYSAYKYWDWLNNYADAFSSWNFTRTIVRTVIMTAAAVGAEFLIGFGLALLFAEKLPLKRLWTVLMLIPMMIVPAVSGFTFFLLMGTTGPLNQLISLVVPGDVQIQWLSDPHVTPISVVIVDVWQWTPLMFLILLSGINSVPDDQLNAARILGANWWQRLHMVVLPIMKPVILIALIIRTMEAFKLFDAAWILTQGGPGEASSTISVKLYRDAIIGNQWGYVAALAIVVMIIVSIAAAQAVKPLERAAA